MKDNKTIQHCMICNAIIDEFQYDFGTYAWKIKKPRIGTVYFCSYSCYQKGKKELGITDEYRRQYGHTTK